MLKLTAEQKQKVKQIAQKYHLNFLAVFGSRVSGKLHKESDIDVAFLPAQNFTFRDGYMLNYELTNVFKNDRVDTVNLKTAPPLLMKEIFDNHQILFRKDKKRYYLYRVYALKKYIEATPLFESKRLSIERFIKTHA